MIASPACRPYTTAVGSCSFVPQAGSGSITLFRSLYRHPPTLRSHLPLHAPYRSGSLRGDPATFDAPTPETRGIDVEFAAADDFNEKALHPSRPLLCLNQYEEAITGHFGMSTRVRHVRASPLTAHDRVANRSGNHGVTHGCLAR